MRRPIWYRRYCVACKLLERLHFIDLMGRYKFIGQWGDSVYRRYKQHVTKYNKFKLWWQPKIKI